ncbi:MAG: phage tail tape measure protein [Sarcina sp.]
MSNSVIVTIKANSAEFTSSMKQVNSELRVTDSNFKLLSTQAKLFGSNSEFLKAQQEQYSATLTGLNEKLGIQTERLAVLDASYASLDASMESNSAMQVALNEEKIAAIETYGAESEQVTLINERLAELNREYTLLSGSMNKVTADTAKTTMAMNATQESMARTEANLDRVNAAFATRHIDAFSSSMGKVSSISGKVSSSLRPLSFGLLAVGGYAGYASIKFGNALAKLSTIADTSKVSISSFKSSILALSNQTGESSSSIAESAYQAISAGVKTGDTMKFVSQATELAKAGFTDTGHTVDVLTTILNAYGLKASDVGRISNDLIRTQNLGKTTVNELSSSMGAVIPIAASTGVNLQQLSTAFVLLTKQGIKTSMAGTDIKSMLNELSKSGSKSDEILRNLTGQGFGGLIKSGKSVGDVLQILKNYANASGKNLNDMFGNVRAGTAAIDLCKNGSKEFNSTLEAMTKKGNDTNIAFQKISQTAGFKLHKSLIQLQNAAIQLGGALTPIITNISLGLSKIATTISSLSPKQLKLITNIGLSIIAFTAFTGVLSKVTGGLSLLGGGVSKTLTYFKKGKNDVSGFTKSIGTIKKVTSMAGQGLKLLWGILMANPIILIVAGLVALGVAFYECYEHCTTFRNGVNEAFSIISKVFKIFINFLTSIFKPLWDTTISSLKGPMKDFSNTMSSLWNAITYTIKTFINFLVSNFKTQYDDIMKSLGPVIKALKPIFDIVFNSIRSLLSIFIGFLKGNFVAGFKYTFTIIGTTIKIFLGVIRGIITMITGILRGLTDFLVGVFTGNWTQALNGLKEIWSGVWNGMSQIVTSIWSGIISIIEGAISYITSIISNIFGAFDKIKSVATSIGHSVGHALGFHVITPNAKPTQSFFAIPKKQGPQSFMSLGSSLNSLENVSAQVNSIGKLTTNNEFGGLDINNLVDKVVSKISNAIIKSNTDKIIQTNIHIDGREIAKATSKPLNNIQNSNQFILKRNGGY